MYIFTTPSFTRLSPQERRMKENFGGETEQLERQTASPLRKPKASKSRKKEKRFGKTVSKLGFRASFRHVKGRLAPNGERPVPISESGGSW